MTERKIDIYARTFDGARHHATGKYLCSTTQSRTCGEAIDKYVDAQNRGDITTGYAASDLTARFDRRHRRG